MSSARSPERHMACTSRSRRSCNTGGSARARLRHVRDKRKEEHERNERERDREARGPVALREEDERRGHRGARADVRELPRKGGGQQLSA